MPTGIETALFAGLDAAERRALEVRLRPHRFAPGAIILHQGQWSRALHLVRQGVVSVTVGDSFGHQREVARLGPGEIVGEMAVLTGQPHSATVSAIGPAETLTLGHDDFLTLLAGSPRLAQNVLRALSERLSRTSRWQVADERAATVAVLSPFDEGAAPILALNLAISVARQTRRRVLLAVDEATLAGPLRPLGGAALPALERVAGDGTAVAAHRGAGPGHPALRGVQICPLRDGGAGTIAAGVATAAVEVLGDSYRAVVLGSVAGGEAGDDLGRAMRALVLAPVGRLREAAGAPAIASLRRAGLPVGLVATDLPRPPSVGELATLGDGAGLPVLRGLPVRLAALGASPLPPLVRRDRHGAVAAGIDWLARDLAGFKVGLALGAGSARGFAHLGVLRVLEREGVPVDTLAGTSVGAFVGAYWSCGLALDAVADAMERTTRRPFGLTVPRTSLFSNRRIETRLRDVVGERQIEDLAHPFAAVSVDLLTGEPVALHRGSLWRAVLASGAIPGLYPPVAYGDRLLVDGVIGMPVPTGVVADLGGDVIIGVRLTPSRAAGLAARPAQVNVADVFLGIIDVMQEAIESHGIARADLLIHPQVTKVPLRHFAEGRALIAAGEVAAEEALPVLRRLLPWLAGPPDRD